MAWGKSGGSSASSDGGRSPGSGIVLGSSTKIQEILGLIHQVAPTLTTILLQGESGSGKELLARLIHELSNRGGSPFIKVVCGALPETLIESELFGYEKGAFTGAEAAKPGRFELANGGTIFLDEIGDLSPPVQVKLLRVLENREYERVGGVRTLHTDVRVVAATHRDLSGLVRRGEFRDDLYYRLNVVAIQVPPLRERIDDLPILVEAFLAEFAVRDGKAVPPITVQALEILRGYPWPGNVRELRNAIERAITLDKDGKIDSDDVQPGTKKAGNTPYVPGTWSSWVDPDEVEQLLQILVECNYKVAAAARRYGVSRQYFYRLLEKYGIPRKR